MRIAILSDTHLAAAAVDFTRNLDVAITWVEALGPDLVIHLGDITADGARDVAQFAYARDRLAQISAPLLALPGNHDVGDSPPSDGTKEPALDLPSLAAFRAAFGADRWSLRAEGWLLIGLNAQLFDSRSVEEGEQEAWLASELSNGVEPVALFLHKPLFLDASDDNPVHGRYAPIGPRQRLLTSLAERDVRLVASGHVHQARLIEDGSVTRLWAPSTAFLIPDTIQETIGRKVCGVTILELQDCNVGVRFETPPGLRDYDLLDHPEVYPQVAGMRNLP